MWITQSLTFSVETCILTPILNATNSLMNTEKHYLTKEKYEELKKELEQARTIGRKEVAQELEYAKLL